MDGQDDQARDRGCASGGGICAGVLSACVITHYHAHTGRAGVAGEPWAAQPQFPASDGAQQGAPNKSTVRRAGLVRGGWMQGLTFPRTRLCPPVNLSFSEDEKLEQLQEKDMVGGFTGLG